MKKAVFISLLVFMVFVLSSCVWMITNFDLNGKWWLAVETVKYNGSFEKFIISYSATDAVKIEIKQEGTHLIVEFFDFTQNFEEILGEFKPLILEGTINNQSFQTSYATSITLPEGTPITLTFSLNGDVITKDYIRAYFVLNISGEIFDNEATSIDYLTLICNGSRLDWGEIF